MKLSNKYYGTYKVIIISTSFLCVFDNTYIHHILILFANKDFLKQTELAALVTISPYAQTRISTSSQIVTTPHKSFAVELGGNRSSPSDEAPFLVPCIKGDALCIRIGQEEYSKGLAECQNALRGRLTLNKGD